MPGPSISGTFLQYYTVSEAKMSKLISNLKFLSVAGVGLFGDGFLNISIGLIVPVIGLLYYKDEGGKIPTVRNDAIKGGLSLGMILGQLVFGLFGDALGRHKIYGKELIITIFGTLMLIVPPTYLGHDGIVAWLVVFRIITGFGIGGGEYNVLGWERGMEHATDKIYQTIQSLLPSPQNRMP